MNVTGKVSINSEGTPTGGIVEHLGGVFHEHLVSSRERKSYKHSHYCSPSLNSCSPWSRCSLIHTRGGIQ